MADQIYVMVGSEQIGPISEAEVKGRVAKGEVGPTSLVWHPGLEEWKPVSAALPHLLGAEEAAVPAPEPEEGGEKTMFVSAADVAAAGPAATTPSAADPGPAATARAAAERAPREAAAAEPAVDVLRSRQPARVEVSEPAPAAVGDRPTARWESHGTVFEVIYGDYHQMPKITLRNNSCVVEAGAMHYVRGQIEMEVGKASVSGFMKSALTKEAATRPKYTGTGEVYLEPTLGEVNMLELNGEEWVLDRGAFLASDTGVEVGMFTNKAWSGLLSGEGFFQTKVSGTGKVFFLSDGVCQRIELRNDKLMVDGSFAVARSASLEFNVQKATKGLIGTLRSGEGLVNMIQGSGSVYIAPIPNRSQRLFKRLDLIRAALTSGKKR